MSEKISKLLSKIFTGEMDGVGGLTDEEFLELSRLISATEFEKNAIREKLEAIREMVEHTQQETEAGIGTIDEILNLLGD